MYSYITSELPKTVFSNFAQIDGKRVSIMGHSMGGHGALTLVSAEKTPADCFLGGCETYTYTTVLGGSF